MDRAAGVMFALISCLAMTVTKADAADAEPAVAVQGKVQPAGEKVAKKQVPAKTEPNKFEKEATYKVVGCRNAHQRHAKRLRAEALAQCRAEGGANIKWLRYKPKRCRYKNKGKSPTYVNARITFVCMGKPAR